MHQAIKTKITEQGKSATEPVLKRRFCFSANGNGKPEIKNRPYGRLLRGLHHGVYLFKACAA